MAVTSIWKVEGRLARVLGYAGNPDKAEGSPDEWELQGVGAAILYAADPGKTERQLYVTGVNCLPATALEEMNATKRQYGKTGGIVAFHGYQAFAPGETDPATAHEVGVALAQELWGGRFEVVVATHLDKAHLHNHFVVNSVSFADGRRFHRDAACYRAMREASDELCREHGLSVVESPGRGGARHHAEWRAEREGRPTWRSLVKADVDEAVGRAASMRQFHANLRAMGYDVKVGKDISVRPPGKERFVRLRRNFGDAYSQEGIGARILANSRQRLPLGRPRPAPKERPPVPKGTLVSLYRRYMALRITGAGAKNAAAMLLAAAASNEKTKGRARLSAMLKSGRELRVFPIRFDDLKGFAKESRRYGIAYAVVKQKDGESVDLLVRTEDASKVNRIAERLGLCRMRDDAREAPEPREGNRHDGRAHAAQAPRAPEQAAALLDDLLASPGDSDASPLAQAPAESRPSGPTSARKRLSEKDGEAARKRCGRLSVRAEMRAISAAREMSGEAHATRKPMARALEKGR